jgi:hypothetical protein
MTTLSLGHAAWLRGRGKTIFARAISGRFFAGNKEDGGSNTEGAELARVYRFLLLTRRWQSCGPVSRWPRSGCPS